MTDKDAQAAEVFQQPRPWIVPEEYEVGASRWLSRALDALKVSLHPLLGSFSREIVHDLPEPEPRLHQPPEGADPAESSSATGKGMPELASPLFRSIHITQEWVMSLEEAIYFDVEALLSRIYEGADELGGQLVHAMFQHISDICEANGQVVSAAEGSFHDALIDAIEKMDIGFDNDGTPTALIAMNHATFDKISSAPPTPEQEERLRIITEHKRKAWLAARRRRELPEVP